MYGICGGEFEIKVFFFFGFQMNRIDSKKIAEKKFSMSLRNPAESADCIVVNSAYIFVDVKSISLILIDKMVKIYGAIKLVE